MKMVWIIIMWLGSLILGIKVVWNKIEKVLKVLKEFAEALDTVVVSLEDKKLTVEEGKKIIKDSQIKLVKVTFIVFVQ